MVLTLTILRANREALVSPQARFRPYAPAAPTERDRAALTVRPNMGKWRHIVALPFLLGLTGCIEVTTYTSPAASGTILDATSQKPIQGATISVDGKPGLFAQTNSDGQFILPPTTRTTHIFVLAPYRSLRPGGAIVVSADGYASKEIVVDAGSDTLLVLLARVR
jgi:hypothetical protein